LIFLNKFIITGIVEKYSIEVGTRREVEGTEI
jgi:hypothetical protein